MLSLQENKTKTSGYVSVASSSIFCRKLASYLYERLGLIPKISTISRKHDKSASLRMSKKDEMMQFLDWIYVDSSICLDRKFAKYSEFKRNNQKENIHE